MKKDVQLKFALLLMLFVASFAACDDDDEKIDAGSPDFTFNSETGEYNVRIGKEVALCARVKDAVNPVYTWKREGKIVADDTVYYFKGDFGESFVNFRLDADNGSVEKQVKVTVVDRLARKLLESARWLAGSRKSLPRKREHTDEQRLRSYGAGRVV
ncbi:MAG: PKD-like domain-containing protein [Butyricimonas paravirosa]